MEQFYIMDRQNYPQKGGIYGIKNKETGQLYIGQTNNFKHRLSTHYAALEKGTHHNPLLQMDWNKNGRDTFELYIIEEIEDVTIRSEREVELIKSTENIYNINKHPQIPERRKKLLTPRRVYGKTYSPNMEDLIYGEYGD